MTHFNRLSPAQTERLALLMEECAEVQQIIGKILRHGYASFNPIDDAIKSVDNQTLLEKEIGHIKAALELMLHEHDIDIIRIDHWMHKKLETVQQWLHHQPKRMFVGVTKGK
jgi:hypothetical protein